MNKILLCLILSVLVSGCEKSYTENTGEYLLPEGLEDCKIYNLRSDRGAYLKVVRCPNSNTTTQSGGKHKVNVTVVEE